MVWTSTIPGHGSPSMTTRRQQASQVKRKARRLAYGKADPSQPRQRGRVRHPLRSFARTGSRRLSEVGARLAIDQYWMLSRPAEPAAEAKTRLSCQVAAIGLIFLLIATGVVFR